MCFLVVYLLVTLSPANGLRLPGSFLRQDDAERQCQAMLFQCQARSKLLSAPVDINDIAALIPDVSVTNEPLYSDMRSALNELDAKMDVMQSQGSFFSDLASEIALIRDEDTLQQLFGLRDDTDIRNKIASLQSGFMSMEREEALAAFEEIFALLRDQIASTFALLNGPSTALMQDLLDNLVQLIGIFFFFLFSALILPPLLVVVAITALQEAIGLPVFFLLRYVCLVLVVLLFFPWLISICFASNGLDCDVSINPPDACMANLMECEFNNLLAGTTNFAKGMLQMTQNLELNGGRLISP